MKRGPIFYGQKNSSQADTGVPGNGIIKKSHLDGYYGIVCSDDTLSAETIIETYQGLWKIEESFRVMKSNLEARPLFVWTPESIQGHFVLCYLSLVLQRWLEYQLKTNGIDFSTARIQDACRSANVSIMPQEKGTDYYIKNTPNTDFNAMLEGLALHRIPTVGKTTQIKL